jgi:tetratricopeptide (TPR) repeat protein
MNYKTIMTYALLVGTVCYSNTHAKDDTDTYHNFILTSYHQLDGKLDKAHKGYQRLLLSPDTPIHVYKGYLPYLAAAKDYRQILLLMPKLQQQFELDPDIQLIFGLALEASGQQDEADKLYIKLSRQFKTHPEIIYQAVNSYRRNKERMNAIQLIDDLLNNSPRKPNNFIFYFMQAQLYTELSDAKNARDSVGKSLELHPNFDKGWLLFGMLEENAGKLDDAIKGYTNFLEISATSNQQLEKHLLELLIKRRMLNSKQKAMAIDNKCLLDGLAHFQNKQYRKGLHAIDKCLETEPAQKEDATIIKINMFNGMRKQGRALQLLKENMLQDPYNEIWYTQLHALCLNGVSTRRALRLLQDITYEHPHAAFAHIHIAELYEKKGNLREGIFHYQRALEYVQDDHTRTHIMYNLACLHSKRNDYERMKSLIASIAKISPDFMPAQHLLAYHYLEHEKNIEQATKLLNNVLAHDPHNAYYRITHARLLHANKQYDQALQTLRDTRIYTSHAELIDQELHTLAHDYITTHLETPHTT